MHLAWDISELVDLICESSSKASLASLAQTSSRFREPALDVLWREMDSAVPLLKCFPPDSWEISTLDDQPFSFVRVFPALPIFCRRYNSGEQNFTRIIRANDWDRVRLHGPRIKEIIFDGRGLYLGVNVADTLQSALCGRHMLPELRKMTWRMGEFPFRHFTSFLGPIATKILVNLDSNPLYMQKLWNLALRTPPITELTISGTGYRYTSDSSFEANFVRRLEHLRLIDIQVFEPLTIHHIANLRDLESLSLALHTLPPDAAAPAIPGAFPALRRLKLWSYNTVWPTYIVNLLRRAPLTEISLIFGPWVEHGEDEAWVAFTRLNQAIHTHCSASTLTSFRAEYGDWDGRIPSSTVDIMRPLCAFYNLRSLVIRGARIDLTDLELRELVEAWSRLESLDLGSGSAVGPVEPPSLTLSCLSIVAAYCPALVELSLEMDVGVIPALNTSEVAQSNLRKLRLTSSSPAVGAYIARIFPRIETIEATVSGD